MVDRKVLRLSDGTLAEHADLVDLAPANCNDMVVDARGRAYVGNFGFDMYARRAVAQDELRRASTPTGDAWIAADELSFPNGPVVTPDGRTLIVGESIRRRASPRSTSPTTARCRTAGVWASLREIGATPDGICLDAEGAIWVACPASDRCVRVAEGGELLDEVRTGRGTFACALGGPDGRTLFICTADAHEPAAARRRDERPHRDATVDVPGAGCRVRDPCDGLSVHERVPSLRAVARAARTAPARAPRASPPICQSSSSAGSWLG